MPCTLPWKSQLLLSFTCSETSLRQESPCRIAGLQLPRLFCRQIRNASSFSHAQNSFLFIKLVYTTFPAALITCFVSSSCHPGLPSFSHPHYFPLYNFIKNARNVHINVHVLQSSPHLPSTYIQGDIQEEGNYTICLCLVLSDWVLKILFDLVFKTDVIYSLNH